MAKNVPATLFWSGEDRQYIWQKKGSGEKRVELSAEERVFRLLDEATSALQAGLMLLPFAVTSGVASLIGGVW